MTAEQILRDSFTAHEHLAADADDTLAGVYRQLDGRRRGRLVAAASIGGTVAVVAVLALGTVELGNRSAAPKPPVAAATTAPRPTPTPKPAPRTALPMPAYTTISSGWLPAGTRQEDFIANGDGGQSLGTTITSGQTSTYVLLGLQPGRVLPSTYKRGTPHDLTIAGHPAREWSVDDWYHLDLLLDGQVASVEIEGGAGGGKGNDGSAATLAAVGRHVAATFRVGARQPIKTGLAFSYLPAGLRVSDIVSANQQVSFTLAGAAAPVSTPDAQPPTVTWQQGGPPNTLAADAGRAVQGHPTLVSTAGAYPVLLLPNVHPGVDVRLDGGDGVTTLAQLYAIADGLILS